MDLFLQKLNSLNSKTFILFKRCVFFYKEFLLNFIFGEWYLTHLWALTCIKYMKYYLLKYIIV